MKRRIFMLLVFGIMVGLPIRASAAYYLPYPSYMPGNKLYRISLFLDKLEAYWYWGNIASARYHLKLSDKYLVEAKTLFEYDQYLLAITALRRSDLQFAQIMFNVNKAAAEGKDVTQLRQLIKEADQKHTEVLTGLLKILPDQYVWAPERQIPQTLDMKKILKEALAVREDLAK